jgi:hypothetical protein
MELTPMFMSCSLQKILTDFVILLRPDSRNLAVTSTHTLPFAEPARARQALVNFHRFSSFHLPLFPSSFPSLVFSNPNFFSTSSISNIAGSFSAFLRYLPARCCDYEVVFLQSISRRDSRSQERDYSEGLVGIGV